MEPDEAALAIIVGTLEPYGFVIKNITSGDQIVELAKQSLPSLMMVSVEPNKMGYAICNKIKRNADLKQVPLILTSSEETPEKFEQHKTFKLRADDYIFKPLDRHELMRKVNVLVGLEELDAGAGSVPTASDEIFLNSDVISSEIAIDADDIVDETKFATPPPHTTEYGVSPPTNPQLGPHPVLDAMFEKEAEAAFDALEMATPPPAQGVNEAEGATATKTLSTPAIQAETAQTQTTAQETTKETTKDVNEEAEPPSPDNEGWAEESATHAAPSLSFKAEDLPGLARTEEPNQDPNDVPQVVQLPELATAGIFATSAEIEGDPELLRRSAESVEDVPPLPDEVRNTSVVAYTASATSDAGYSDLQKRVHELEDDKRELATVIEDLRAHLQSQPFHKEKDLLGLRETINRKEKEVLDLRDAVDAKDRQILDHKDRMREHERARRDLEEKLITFEKSLMHANERVLALTQDKEKSIERERGLKVRLDDAHIEIGKNHDELDLLKKRLASLEDRARAEVERVRNELELKIAEDEESHRSELARIKDDREAEKAAREDEVQTEIARLTSNHATEIELLHKRHADEKSSLAEGHDIEIARIRREHEKAVVALREEHATAIENEKMTYQSALEANERDYKNDLTEQRRTADDTLAAAEDRRARELEEAETRRIADLDLADARRRSELQARDEQHHAATAEMERRHLAEKTETTERHRVELSQAHARISELETEVAARNEELAETHRRLLRIEGELDTSRTDLRDREVKLGQARDRITEIEARVADLEDQALRAYRRIKDDEKTIDKAKRAVSVALTLLDERSSASVPPISRSGDENPT
jgi:CheY-like chemotaxis protein